MANDPNYKEEKKKDPMPGGKAKRNRKVYPPHWEIRGWGFNEKKRKPHYMISSKSIPWYGWLDIQFRRVGTCFLMRNFESLEAELDYAAEKLPHTKDWPVRFLNVEPVECGREIIK